VDSAGLVYAGRNYTVAHGRYSNYLPEEEQSANARLIAAAPDLYKELAHIVQLIKPVLEHGSFDLPGLATLNGAHRAMAKARGEETP
jgi:hypothetical protein